MANICHLMSKIEYNSKKNRKFGSSILNIQKAFTIIRKL